MKVIDLKRVFIAFILVILLFASIAKATDDEWTNDADNTVMTNLYDNVEITGSLKVGDFLKTGSNYFYPWAISGVLVPSSSFILSNETGDNLAAMYFLDSMILHCTHEPGTTGDDDIKLMITPDGIGTTTDFWLVGTGNTGIAPVASGGRIISDTDIRLTADGNLDFGVWQDASGTISSSGTAVTGTETFFLTELNPGDKIMISNSLNTAVVDTIASDTSMTITEALGEDLSDNTFKYDKRAIRVTAVGDVEMDVAGTVKADFFEGDVELPAISNSPVTWTSSFNNTNNTQYYDIPGSEITVTASDTVVVNINAVINAVDKKRPVSGSSCDSEDIQTDHARIICDLYTLSSEFIESRTYLLQNGDFRTEILPAGIHEFKMQTNTPGRYKCSSWPTEEYAHFKTTVTDSYYTITKLGNVQETIGTNIEF